MDDTTSKVDASAHVAQDDRGAALVVEQSTHQREQQSNDHANNDKGEDEKENTNETMDETNATMVGSFHTTQEEGEATLPMEQHMPLEPQNKEDDASRMDETTTTFVGSPPQEEGEAALEEQILQQEPHTNASMEEEKGEEETENTSGICEPQNQNQEPLINLEEEKVEEATENPATSICEPQNKNQNQDPQTIMEEEKVEEEKVNTATSIGDTPNQNQETQNDMEEEKENPATSAGEPQNQNQEPQSSMEEDQGEEDKGNTTSNRDIGEPQNQNQEAIPRLPQEPTKKQDQIDTSWMSPDERDLLQAYRLRFSFQHVTLLRVWVALQKAGWIYHANQRQYRPPDVTAEEAAADLSLLMGANEVEEHLDYYSIEADVVSDLQVPPGSHAAITTSETPRLAKGQEDRWRKLRDDAIYHYLVGLLNKQKKREQAKAASASAESNNDNGNEQQQDGGGDVVEKSNKASSKQKTTTAATKKLKKKIQPRSSARRSRNSNHNSSITTADVGADMYHKKDAIKSKHKRKKAQQDKNKNDNTQPDENLPVFERLSLEACQNILVDKKDDELYSLEQVEAVEAEYRQDFKEWRFLSATNHSLLFHGYGSKLQLLNDFARKELSREGYVLVLNGFDPEITMDSILDLLVQVFLDRLEPSANVSSLPGFEDEASIPMTTLHTDSKTGEVQQREYRKIRNPVQRATAIAQMIASKKRQAHGSKELKPIYLVIHNLEGAGLRNRLAQETLSTLVAHSKVRHNNDNDNVGGVNAIRLVASFDHVDAPATLWNVQTSANFRWIWKEVHTHRPYTQELVMLAQEEAHISNTASKKRRAAASSSIGASTTTTTGGSRKPKAHLIDGEGADRVMEVLRNLAARYTEVMQILATMQLEVMAGSSSTTGPGGTVSQQQQHQKVPWIDAAQLLQRCLIRCTVKTDSQLRTFLDELKDHELVVVQKQGSTSVMVRIPYSEKKLHEILSYQPFNRN